jgi:hypothetical protein
MSDMSTEEKDMVYNELTKQEMAAQSQAVTKEARKAGTSIVTLVGIVAVMIVALACITACAVVAWTFLQNAPW